MVRLVENAEGGSEAANRMKVALHSLLRIRESESLALGRSEAFHPSAIYELAHWKPIPRNLLNGLVIGGIRYERLERNPKSFVESSNHGQGEWPLSCEHFANSTACSQKRNEVFRSKLHLIHPQSNRREWTWWSNRILTAFIVLKKDSEYLELLSLRRIWNRIKIN